LKVGRTLLIWLKTHRIGDSPPIRELPIFFFSSPFSSIFSLKPWKLRGKVVSLHKKSYKKEIMGHQEDIVKTESKIIIIRDTQVILDRDVAELYGVETRDINKAVKNNPKKFPPGYIIELNSSEKQELVENFHRFNTLKHSTVAPHAFTEQGLYMLATILKGDLAISTTIAIIDTFTQLRKLARTIDKVNEDAKEHGILPDKATEGKIQAAMNEVFADKLPLKMRRLTFGVNLGVLKFSIETKRESKE
jgi:phage regulator Rha-like protein